MSKSRQRVHKYSVLIFQYRRFWLHITTIYFKVPTKNREIYFNSVSPVTTNMI